MCVGKCTTCANRPVLISSLRLRWSFHRFIRESIVAQCRPPLFSFWFSVMLSSALSSALPPLSIGPAERSLLCQLNKVILLGRVLPLVLSRVLLIEIFSFSFFFHCMCKSYRAHWGTELGLLSLTPSLFTSPSCNPVPQQLSITLHLCLSLSSTLRKSARGRERVCILSEKEGSRSLEVKDKQALRESFCPFIQK